MPAIRESAPATQDDELDSITSVDLDSIHILPLSILPLTTPGLRCARLIRNVRLESVIELFGDVASGSGQMDIDALDSTFGWSPNKPHPDRTIIRKMAALPSFDVYSLRILLREAGITVNSIDALTLSPKKQRELTKYMVKFTHPLIREIYGSKEIDIDSFEDVLALFRDPDQNKARDRLKSLAEKLNLQLSEVPKFLEDYGDVFLSLSYYRQCLDHIEPIVSEFLESLVGLRANWQLRNDRNLMKTCYIIQSAINESMAGITGRIENFERNSYDMWNDISAEQFRKVETLITSYHTAIGGVLCALGVKMDAWARLFPTPDTGGPVRRAEFIMSEMKQGIEKIQKIEDQSPMLSALEERPPA